MVEVSAMCAVNEGVHLTSPEQSDSDVTSSTGVNGVQGRYRVINIGVRQKDS
ncbi:MAG: hypothetical protein K2M98_01965 [Muribaculum sp.]|nr:hypothetical protein [Muribaculum sp.]